AVMLKNQRDMTRDRNRWRTRARRVETRSTSAPRGSGGPLRRVARRLPPGLRRRLVSVRDRWTL
ncbi:MAG: hypothetical protein ACRDOJ_07740, partial [Nocardioidaceae bacterium]